MRIAGALKVATIVLGVGIYAAATLYLMPTVFTEIWGHSAEEGEVHGGGRMLSHANHPHMRAHAHGPAGQAQHRHPHSARYGQKQQPQPQDVRYRAAVALADLRARVKTRLADAWQHAMERKLSIDAAGAGDRASVPLASALMSDGGSLQDAVALHQAHQVQPAHAPPATPAAAAAPAGSGVGALTGTKERTAGGIAAQAQPAVYGRRWGVQAAGGG